jgi:hypothetical protein
VSAKAWLDALGDVGWIADQEKFELGPNTITGLQNFRVHSGWAEKVHGYRQVFTSLGSEPYFITPFMIVTAGVASRYLVECTASAVYADDGSNARATITPATGLTNVVANAWSAAVMNGVLGMNNGTNVPMYWTGTGVLASLPGWTATHSAKALCALKEHWVALNITKAGVQYPHRVKVSAACLPGSPGTSWDQTDPTTDAYEVDAQGDGQLIWGLPLGDSLIIYSDSMPHQLRYTGNVEQPWSLQPMAHLPFGMLAINCGVVVPGVGHVVLTKDDVVAHDGQSYRSILDGTAKQWLVDNMDADYYANSYVVADFSKAEVQICFPEVGHSSCTKAILWNWVSGKLGQKDLPNTRCGCRASFNYATEQFDNDTVTFDSESVLTFDTTNEVFAANESRVIMAGDDLKVFVMDSSETADTAAFTGYIELGALVNFVPELKGRQQLLTDVWIDIDADVGTQISVYFGAASDPQGVISYGAPFTFAVGTHRKAEGFACGPYPALKLSSTGWFRVRSMAPVISDEGEF